MQPARNSRSWFFFIEGVSKRSFGVDRIVRGLGLGTLDARTDSIASKPFAVIGVGVGFILSSS